MAIPTHIAIIGHTQVPNDGSGSITIKDNPNFTLGDATVHTREMRILEDTTDIPNSAGYPTVKEYILAEALVDYRLVHLDQTYCITQLIP